MIQREHKYKKHSEAHMKSYIRQLKCLELIGKKTIVWGSGFACTLPVTWQSDILNTTVKPLVEVAPNPNI